MPVVCIAFDDPNLVSCAGLVPVMRLADEVGLHDAVAGRVRLPSDKGANPAGKLTTIVAGMLAGGDRIDDLDIARHGGMRSLFSSVYAPSTLGSFLRTFTKMVITTCRRRDVRFSVTTRIDAKIRAACDSIATNEWLDIKYPQAVFDEDTGRWISDAQIAETVYTAFASTRHAVSARLIVRRIRRDDTAKIPGQGNLLATYR
jgi:hypothetical protein